MQIKWHTLLLVVSVLITPAKSAFAQSAAVADLEPVRFAVLIGNKDYGGAGSLLTPCDDAKAIGKALNEIGWTDVRALCDLKNEQLRKEIVHFTTKILSTPRAYGILYYAGHAAQVGTRNYLFGIDFELDVNLEKEVYKADPEAPLFSDYSVNLDLELLRLNNMFGKAAVVIIDACRDNPILTDLLKANINAAKYPAKTTDTTGIMYAFATKNGRAAPDGFDPPGSGGPPISLYSSIISDEIRRNGGRGTHADLLISRVNTMLFRASKRQQEGDRAGQIFTPPDFCLTGCASSSDQWRSVFSPENFERVLPSSSLTRSVPQRRVEYDKRKRILLASNASSSSFDNDGSAKASRPRSIRVDAFYCEGTPTSQAALQRANDAAEKFRGISEVIDGSVIGDVRVRPLPPKVNRLKQYQVASDAVYYSQGAELESKWAKRLNAASGNNLDIKVSSRKSPDYLSVFFCENTRIGGYGYRVYVQVGSQDQAEPMRGVLQSAGEEVGGLYVFKDFEKVEKSPMHTEVRFFSAKYKAKAELLAASLSKNMSEHVEAKFVSGYERKLSGSPILEIWVGASFRSN